MKKMLVTVLIVFLCVMTAAFAENDSVSEQKYQELYEQALGLLASDQIENSDEAYRILWLIPDYKDSSELCYQYGLRLIKAGRYEDAYKVYMRLSGYKDADEKAYALLVATRVANSTEKISDTSAVYYFHSLYGIISFDNNVIIPPKWEDIRALSADFYGIKENDLWGVMDVHGNYVFQPQWDAVSDAEDNKCIIYDDNRLGLINLNGEVLQKCIWKQIGISYIDAKNEPQINAPIFINNRIRVQNSNNRWGYLDTDGGAVIPAKYLSVTDFYTDYATVLTENNGYMMIDVTGKEVMFTNSTYIDELYQPKYAEAVKLFEAEKYEEAIKAFRQLSYYKDSEVRILAAYYMIGSAQFRQNDFSGAITSFTRAKDYPGASEALNKAKYAQATVWLNTDKEYQQAMQLFGEISEYADSVTKRAEAAYQYACQLIEAGSYADAEQVLGDDYGNAVKNRKWNARSRLAKAMQSIKLSTEYGIYEKFDYSGFMLYDEAVIYPDDADTNTVPGIVIRVNNTGKERAILEDVKIVIDEKATKNDSWGTIIAAPKANKGYITDQHEHGFKVGKHDYAIIIDGLTVYKGHYEVKKGISPKKQSILKEIEGLSYTVKLAKYDGNDDKPVEGYTALTTDLAQGETYIATLHLQNNSNTDRTCLLSAVLDDKVYTWVSRTIGSNTSLYNHLGSILTKALTTGKHHVVFYYNGVPLCEQDFDIQEPAISIIDERTISFGRYEQDNNTNNGPEPIEWIILDTLKGKALVISKYLIKQIPYSQSGTTSDWKTSNIRKWLNEDFINTAFKEKEQQLIESVLIDFEENDGKSNYVFDKVFIFNETEADRYFPSKLDKRCTPKDKTVYKSWWLRSPKKGESLMPVVRKNGIILGEKQQYSCFLRPCLWVDLSSVLENTEPENSYETAEATHTEIDALTSEASQEAPGQSSDSGEEQPDNTDKSEGEPYRLSVLLDDVMIHLSDRILNKNGEDEVVIPVDITTGHHKICVYMNGLFIHEYEFEANTEGQVSITTVIRKTGTNGDSTVEAAPTSQPAPDTSDDEDAAKLGEPEATDEENAEQAAAQVAEIEAAAKTAADEAAKALGAAQDEAKLASAKLAEMTRMAEPALAEYYKNKTVILHSNDVHGALDGYAYIAYLKGVYESYGANVILVDAGDFSQGTIYVSTNKGQKAIEMMNAAGYDVVTLGNHEFDFGYAQLMENLKGASFKTICANVFLDATNEPILPATTIIERNGVKIGFFGLETPETAMKVNPGLISEIRFTTFGDLYTTAQSAINELNDADVVIGLSHLGVDEESAANGYRSTDLLRNTTGVDFLIDGHSHTVMTKGEAGESIQSTGTRFEYVGVIVIDNAKKAIVDNYLISTKDLQQDAAVAAKAEEIMRAIDAEYGAAFAQSSVRLNGDRDPGNRTQETNLGDLITDAMVWSVVNAGGISEDMLKNVVGITNGGSIRASIEAGGVSMKDINTVLPFGNTVSVIYVKGSELLEVLEASTFSTPKATGAYPQTSGISWIIDTTKEYSQGEIYRDANGKDSAYYSPASIDRVTIQSINGKPFDPDALYAVVTNNFCAAGGDTYNAFMRAYKDTEHPGFDTGIPVDQAVMDYVYTELGGKIGNKYAEPRGTESQIRDEADKAA